MVSEEHIPQRCDNFSDLYDVCRLSARISYIKKNGKQFNYLNTNNIDPINNMTNSLYVMIVDWKDWWEDI